MKISHYLVMLSAMLLAGCTGLEQPTMPPAVSNFELDRYLGTWYEIVRLPHHFENGLDNVTATYSMREDGGVAVLNQGKRADGTIAQAHGRAYFTGQPTVGQLKVTFFWPFYGQYRIIRLDSNYQWAVVTSSSRDYFWILSRQPQLPGDLLEKLVMEAATDGYATSQFIYVKHDKAQETVKITGK